MPLGVENTKPTGRQNQGEPRFTPGPMGTVKYVKKEGSANREVQPPKSTKRGRDLSIDPNRG